MFDLFGVDFDALELSQVEAFLANAAEEGLTWEAKADDDEDRTRREGEEPGQLHARTIQKAAAGLANQIGGYLILGARWDKSRKCWRLPGIVIPGDEPELWIGKTLRNLRPVPRFRPPRIFETPGGRVVAVVEIEPIDEPPCMTPLGHVYERVSGETKRVTDPVLLDSLLRRGREARGRAEGFAGNAAAHAAKELRRLRPWEHALSITVGLAPVGRETDDISSRLFVPSFKAALEGAIWALFGGGQIGQQPSGFTWLTKQDSLGVIAHIERHADPTKSESSERRTDWLVQGRWTGAVAAGVGLNAAAADELDIGLVRGIIYPVWDQLAPLCERLGGYGPAHLTMRISRPEALPRAAGSVTLFEFGDTEIKRVVTLGADATRVLTSLNREVERSAGMFSWEAE